MQPPAAVYSHYAVLRPLQAADTGPLHVVEPPLRYEWLGPVNYWRGGGTAPVWFLADRRRTVVFATGVQHSVHLRDEFRRSGVRAEHIDGQTPTLERDAILAGLARGDIELVTNCMVLTEGWDQPEVQCLILARPTRHMGLYRQMVGRGLRPAPRDRGAASGSPARVGHPRATAADPRPSSACRSPRRAA